MDVRKAKRHNTSKGKRNVQTLPGSKEAQPLLGALRQAMLLEITSGEERTATDEEITTWTLKKYQDNPLSGDIYHALLYLEEDYVSPSDQLPTSKAALKQLYALEHYPIPEFFFVSTDYENESIGFLFQREALKDGGRVYSVTGFNSRDLGGKVSRLEFRVNAVSPEPFVLKMSNNGYIQVRKEVFFDDNYLALAFNCLAAYCDYRYPPIDTDRIIDIRVSSFETR